MGIRNRDLKITIRQSETDEGEKKYYLRLTYKPTGDEVEGKGSDLDVLRADLQGQLEEIILIHPSSN